jgi:hypothetical protein
VRQAVRVRLCVGLVAPSDEDDLVTGQGAYPMLIELDPFSWVQGAAQRHGDSVTILGPWLKGT